MAITIESLSELSTTDVQTNRALIVQLLREAYPTLELRRGPVYDLLVTPHAALATATQTQIDRVRKAGSLNELMADPSLSTDELIDIVCSNYQITRLPGSAASGNVTIVISTAASVTIPAGSVFEANGLLFTTATSFSSRLTEQTVVDATDRLLTSLPDGTYYFLIDVTASATGSASQLLKDTALIPQNNIPYYVRSYATSDFIDGRDAETNEALLARLAGGRAAKALSGRLHMSAALRAEASFENVVADSIVGFGDQEMLRDAHAIFPFSGGSRVDWYVRPTELPQSVLVTKTATLVEVDNETGAGIWQFSIDRDDAPGFYDASKVVVSGTTGVSGTLTVVSDVRSYDLTALDNDGFLPDIETADEAAYSRFQTAVMKVADPDTPVSSLTLGNSTQDYDVTLRCAPQIAEIQDYVSSRKVRNAAGDVLVKAAIPCFLSLSFTIELQPAAETPDTDAIKNVLAAAINRYGFTGRIPASYISELIHSELGNTRAYVGAIDVLGRIRRPNQTVRYVRSSDVLIVSAEPSQMVSGRTVAFYLDPADIAITVRTADVLEV